MSCLDSEHLLSTTAPLILQYTRHRVRDDIKDNSTLPPLINEHTL